MSRILETSPSKVYDVGWLDWLERSLAGRSVKETFAANLREALSRRGDARRLAEELGVAPSTISQWKDGLSEPSFEYIEKLSILLGKKPGAWFDDSDIDAPKPPPPTLRQRIAALEKAVRMLTESLESLKHELADKLDE